MNHLGECDDGPFQGYLVAVKAGTTRILVEPFEEARPPAWYAVEYEEGSGAPRLRWDPSNNEDDL